MLDQVALPKRVAGLEPTYKGLKLGRGWSPHVRLRPSSLEPTYKGLKLTILIAVGGGGAGLEPTYKGLKHA